MQVKNFRPTVTSLFEPLAAAVLGREGASASEDEQRELLLLEGLMGVYEYPDQHPGRCAIGGVGVGAGR